jgi:endogenous inhibitor of DNA gyrase (YacG/DUF329 family)
MTLETCPNCGATFERDNTYCKVFCSSRCRTAHWKAQKKAEFGPDSRTPVQKALETKRANREAKKHCANCGELFAYDATQHRKRFCSDACKQAHYRQRQAWNRPMRSAPWITPVETLIKESSDQDAVNRAFGHMLDNPGDTD